MAKSFVRSSFVEGDSSSPSDDWLQADSDPSSLTTGLPTFGGGFSTADDQGASPASTSSAATSDSAAIIITPPPSAAGGGLVINFNFDSSVTNSPYAANIEAAAAAAATFFESTFSNPITITVNFGYGEVNGNSISSSALAQSTSNPGSFSYSQVKSALQANAQTLIDKVAVNTLPSSDPTSSGTHFDVTPAEEKALGLGSSAVDGGMGLALSSSYSLDVYDSNWTVN